VFYATKPDFNVYADAQQSINLAIIERLRAMNVSLAAPNRTAVYFENSLPGGLSDADRDHGLRT
jgi:hypothetical protein